MVLICRNCHSEKFAGDYLNAADEVKLSSDLLVLRARSILDGLARDGFVKSSAAELIQRYRPVAPPPASDSGNAAPPVPNPLPLLTGIESAFLVMAGQENVHTALGAFHASPGGVYWEGYDRVRKSLERVQALDKEMRAAGSKSSQQ
jgi:hypothetical protein